MLDRLTVDQLARLVRTIDRALHDLRIQIDTLHEHIGEVTLRAAPPPVQDRRATPRDSRKGPPLRRPRHDLRCK